MTIIVEDKGTCLHGTNNATCGFGECDTLCLVCGFVGIGEDASQHKCIVCRSLDLLANRFGILHVQIIVAYIAYRPHVILPSAWGAVDEIVGCFID